MSEVKLYNDDAMNVFKTIDAESIDLYVSDVPYPTTARGNAGNSGGMLQKKINLEGKVFDNNSIKPSEYLPQIYRILKDGSHCYIMTNHVNLIEILNEAVKCGFSFIKSLIWVKDNKIMGQFYMSQFEYILFFRKGEGRKINNCGTSDVLYFPNKKLKDDNGQNLHDTEKPIELMTVLVENSSKEGDVVMDSFMGICSTGIACKQLNRNFIGCEIDKKYFDIAEQRINGSFGKINVDDEIFGL